MNAMSLIHTPPSLVTEEELKGKHPEFVCGYQAAMAAFVTATAKERDKAEVNRDASARPSIFGGGQKHSKYFGHSEMASHLNNIARVTADVCRKVKSREWPTYMRRANR